MSHVPGHMRPAGPEDLEFIQTLWTSAENARWLDPPQGYDVEEAMAEGRLLVWDMGSEDGGAEARDSELAGFAFLNEWLPRVWGLREFAVSRPGFGRPLLEAVMADVFTNRDGHRLGLDCTADNHRAMNFFKRAGFQYEGVWRETWDRGDGIFVDCIFFSLLAREWQARPAPV